ncbi:MAG TPA: cation:proton antiporter subunit C [Nitrospiria bacterium]|jgi:multicomponent Na+:H+ antiporter subunit C
MFEIFFSRPNFMAFILLFLFGLFIMVTHKNLIKKLIGMYLLQTSVILFFVALGVKEGSTVPILLSPEYSQGASYANPLPQVLMLTAIVVGVATLGVSLALVIAIYHRYKTLEEDELVKRLEPGE